MQLTKDRSFYKSFLRLCTTLMLEQAVILSVNLADNLMLGTYSEPALAGVAAVNQIQFVFQQVVYAIGTGLITLGSQYWGQQRTREIRSVASTAIRLELLVSLGLFLAAGFCPEGLVRLFSENGAIVAEGAAYLRIIRFSYLFFALTAVLLSAMRTVETVSIALKVSIVSLLINVGLNSLLIYGNLGFPEMGVRGAAVGTLVARIVEFLLVLAFVCRDRRLQLRLRHLLSRDGRLARDYIRVALPVLGSSFLWGIANAMQTVILGHMNDSAIAAQSISSTVFLLLKVTAVGACSAASVIIGKSVGQGAMDKVREYARTLQFIFICIGLVLMTLMLIIRVPLLRVYSVGISEETRALADAYMLIQAGVLLVMSYQMPTNCGIIRGGGNTRYPLILDTAAILTFIPLAWFGGLVWNWSAIAVIVCVNVDQALKCIPASIYVNSYRWVRRLTRN